MAENIKYKSNSTRMSSIIYINYTTMVYWSLNRVISCDHPSLLRALQTANTSACRQFNCIQGLEIFCSENRNTHPSPKVCKLTAFVNLWDSNNFRQTYANNAFGHLVESIFSGKVTLQKMMILMYVLAPPSPQTQDNL